MRWQDRSVPLAKRLVATVAAEGIFFSTVRTASPGTLVGEMLSRERDLVFNDAWQLYSQLEERLDNDTVNAIIREAVAIEKKSIVMVGELMSKYVEFKADGVLSALGHDKIFQTSNPFPTKELSRKNFFEKDVSEY